MSLKGQSYLSLDSCIVHTPLKPKHSDYICLNSFCVRQGDFVSGNSVSLTHVDHAQKQNFSLCTSVRIPVVDILLVILGLLWARSPHQSQCWAIPADARGSGVLSWFRSAGVIWLPLWIIVYKGLTPMPGEQHIVQDQTSVCAHPVSGVVWSHG